MIHPATEYGRDAFDVVSDADLAEDEIEVGLVLVPSFAISQRPVIVFPSSLKVPVNRWANGSPCRQSDHSPSPMLML